MDLRRLFPAALATLALGLGGAQAATLTVIHGIPGQDLGLDPELPVDVSLDGACALTDVPFAAQSDALEVDPGRYDVEIRLADGNCTGTLVIATEVSISLLDDVTVIAHFTDALSLTASKFVNDVRAADDARVTVRHTADAPTVDVYARTGGGEPFLLFAGLSNGDEAKADVGSAGYNVGLTATGVEPSGVADLAFGPVALPVFPEENTVVYAVGSLATGSFTVLVQTLDL